MLSFDIDYIILIESKFQDGIDDFYYETTLDEIVDYVLGYLDDTGINFECHLAECLGASWKINEYDKVKTIVLLSNQYTEIISIIDNYISGKLKKIK